LFDFFLYSFNLPLQTPSGAEARREVIAKIAASGAAFLPVAANAVAGDAPKFSIFGIVGDPTSMSEAAAYGVDQKDPLYSPYSVYQEASDKSIYKPGNAESISKKKAIIAESKKRLSLIPGYIAKKQWFNVKDELTRYMYETRGAVRGLASTADQKSKATDFFTAMEATYGAATLKKGDAALAANTKAIAALDAFVASL
jgi:photosystem II oxygen-evolving enhancer protein 3